MMKIRSSIAGVVVAFSAGALVSLATGAIASGGQAIERPGAEHIGQLYDLPVQDSYKGCRDFAEFADPMGYCLDGVGFSDGEASLVGRLITGRQMSDEEVTIASDIIAVQQLKEDGATLEQIEAADAKASSNAALWWDTAFEGPTVGDE